MDIFCQLILCCYWIEKIHSRWNRSVYDWFHYFLYLLVVIYIHNPMFCIGMKDFFLLFSGLLILFNMINPINSHISAASYEPIGTSNLLFSLEFSHGFSFFNRYVYIDINIIFKYNSLITAIPHQLGLIL